ncbi:hypothetical protein BDN71DRAFT_1452473 [Pleurotus eryngii]|uniref:Uncharacterized protein n=1 Tax=Pleurotus eryngii TaxID=5323 RepID=A0A9P6D410_PLEER|nr:hypothetical protein BDN71DRAFT_1452473 [Pleurotus eryngii]
MVTLAAGEPIVYHNDTATIIQSDHMAFRPFGVQYFPGFVMNESLLFFEAEQSDLPRQKTNYYLHIDGIEI